jgi:hypothetical protein
VGEEALAAIAGLRLAAATEITAYTALRINREDMQIIESQLARLGEITRKSLAFYRLEAEPREFDLVAIAEAQIAGTNLRSLTVTKQFPHAVSIHGREGAKYSKCCRISSLTRWTLCPNRMPSFRLRIRIVGKRVQDGHCG